MDKLISQQAAIDTIKKRLFETAFNNVGIKQNTDETLADVAENRLENWFNELPSAQPDIIRCKDCKYYCEYGYVNGKPKFLPRCTFSAIYVDADDFCSKAERREE